MCGIAGYVGDRESADVLVDALSKLEYRGYDSAGIAVFDHGNIKDMLELAIQDGLHMGNHQISIHIHMVIRELLLYIMVLLRITRSLRIFLLERDIALQVKQILRLRQSCLITTMMAIR